jgi:hypothetical protein
MFIGSMNVFKIQLQVLYRVCDAWSLRIGELSEKNLGVLHLRELW